MIPYPILKQFFSAFFRSQKNISFFSVLLLYLTALNQLTIFLTYSIARLLCIFLSFSSPIYFFYIFRDECGSVPETEKKNKSKLFLCIYNYTHRINVLQLKYREILYRMQKRGKRCRQRSKNNIIFVSCKR